MVDNKFTNGGIHSEHNEHNEENIPWQKARNPNYLGSWDLIVGADEDGVVTYGEKTLTVAKVVQEDVTDMDAIKQGKVTTKKMYVMYFQEPVLPLIIHAKCVLQSIAKATHTILMNKWVGKRLTLYVEKGVRAFGTYTDAIRVKPTAPSMPTIKCPVCGKTVVPITGMTAEQTLAYTEKQLGIRACVECGKKHKEEMAKDKLEKDKLVIEGVKENPKEATNDGI